MVTKIGFAFILLIIAIQRIFEIKKSRKNEFNLKSQGGQEHAPRHFYVMIMIHLAWFISMILEVYFLRRPFYFSLFLLSASFVIMGNWLRYQSMKALGARWTIRIFTIPHFEPVTHGIYKFIRHPIYLGVILEIAFIPLLHTAYMTSVFFSLANARLLKKRIYEEEKALNSINNYQNIFQDKPRLIPNFKPISKS
jgi:methyltransferase